MKSDETRRDAEPVATPPVPFVLGVVPWKQDGALRVTVIVKATFSAQSSPMSPAKAPEPYRAMDVHHRNQPMARVVAPSDRAPQKRAVDVTVLGHAYAKGGLPVPEMSARVALRQGDAFAIDKSVRVVGAPSLSGASSGAEPLPFVRMPVTYERAYGGLGTPANPIGCGEEEADDDERPNILDPIDASRAAGFGPISSAWPIRKKRLGATAPRDVESALVTLPSTFDLSYFQCAPDDQQIPELSPDAVLVLEGFHPEKERLELALPGARAFGAVYGLDANDPDAPTPIDFRADMLHLDADAWIATITFRGSVEIRDESRLDQIVVATGVGLGGLSPHIPDRRPGPEQIKPAAEVSPGGKGAAEVQAGGTLVFESSHGAAIGTLPLAGDGSSLQAGGRSSDTLVLPLSSWSGGPKHDLSAATLALPETPLLSGPLPPPKPLISPPPLMPVPAQPEEQAAASPEAPAPPPLLGGAGSNAINDAEKRPEEIVDIERYGAISAALAEPSAKWRAILDAQAVSPILWRKADRLWRREMDRELKEGKRASREKFDDAYIRAWEAAHPGRFGLSHYARIASAEKQARLAGELLEQGLDASLGMRLRRVWKRRVAADAALGEELKKLVSGRGAEPRAGAE